ncbi:hypothetical protein WG901_19145 [Novosphingobium sp. PS1R-30]|uniref:Uncharacterized protein n=1 Tax=Novosphingobium anseongense TaxID=3133436 RepID=A0ABU8S0B0_9SPHN
MTKFTKFAAPLAIAAAALSLAGAAQAQPYGGPRHDNRHDARGDNRNDAWRLTPARNNEIRQDINSLDNTITRAAQRRTISQREAQGLRRQANEVKRLYAQYARNGLDRNEVRNLQQRVNSVRIALRMERRDWDGRRG